MLCFVIKTQNLVRRDYIFYILSAYMHARTHAHTHTLLVVQILLKELEDFAFKGIPDVRGCHSQDAQLLEEMVSVDGTCSCCLCLSLFVVCILCLSLFVVVCLSL